MKIKKTIFRIKDITFNEALEYLVKNAKISGKNTFVVTLNTEIIMLARNDKEYEKILGSADLLVNDSIGIVWARRVFGKSSKERIHGSDLLVKLSELASKEGLTVGYLGGGKNVALETSECLRKKCPGLKISFTGEEWNQIKRERKCDILFVAFGSPKQEKWIYENLAKIDVNLAIGVGGAFDFVSGRVSRAPKWIRRIGLEWLYRLMIQPWRIKRQMALPKFVFLVLREKFLG